MKRHPESMSVVQLQGGMVPKESTAVRLAIAFIKMKTTMPVEEWEHPPAAKDEGEYWVVTGGPGYSDTKEISTHQFYIEISKADARVLSFYSLPKPWSET